MNRAGGTSDHANRITALHAGLNELKSLVDDPFAYESRISIVRRGTCLDTIIATRAAMKVDDHRLSAIEQPILNEKF